MLRALYLTYDGLTDSLGQSQIIPYLEGLSKRGHEIHILSCEKPHRYRAHAKTIRTLLEKEKIRWFPISYNKKPPVVSAVWDLYRMKRLSKKLHKKYHYDLLHCRGYLPSLVGENLKTHSGIPFVFDMRGFWADERVEGNVWDLERPIYNSIYRYFKKKEKDFLTATIHAISLTERGKQEISSWNLKQNEELPIEVIPCCADFDKFSKDKIDPNIVSDWRRKLDIDSKTFVVTYLGSLGTWYLLDEMLGFFKRLLVKHPKACFLIVTHDDSDDIFLAASRLGIDEKNIRVTAAARNDVPPLLALSNLGLFFIKPVYSKMASSASKFGEMLSMGLPVVTNSNVGDHDRILENHKVGLAVNGFSDDQYDKVISQLDTLMEIPARDIRSAGESELSLNEAINRYAKVYQRIDESLAYAQ